MIRLTRAHSASVWLGLAAAMASVPAHSEKITCAETELPLSSAEELLAMLPKRAAVCAQEGKPAQSIALLTRLISQKPDDAIAYLNRGSAQAVVGEVALAISDYTTAIHLKSDLVEAWYNRGTTYTRIRRYEKATSDFTDTQLRTCFLQSWLRLFPTR